MGASADGDHDAYLENFDERTTQGSWKGCDTLGLGPKPGDSVL